MSRIYFHSPTDTFEIYGRERAHMRLLCEGIAFGVLVGHGLVHDWMPRLLPPNARPLRELEVQLGCAPRFLDAMRYHLSDSNARFVVDGQSVSAWETALNSVLAIGSDPVKLCARLHGQCEIHAFVDGSNRAWLAGIIRRGIADRVMRDGGYGGDQDYGKGQWSDLASWLESRSDEPVVTSYSVCEPFPNATVAGWEGPDEDDGADRGWYDLTSAERWFRAMEGLRSGAQYHGVEMKPDGWESYRFGACLDLFQLYDFATAKDDTGFPGPIGTGRAKEGG